MKRLIIVLVSLLIIGGGIFGLYQYNRDHGDIGKENPEYSMDAAVLFSEFNTDETAANEKYLDEVLEVTGIIKKIDKGEESNPQVFLESDDLMFGILCEMAAGPLPQDLEPGSKVTLRGICSGYLMDVVLNRCVIIEK